MRVSAIIPAYNEESTIGSVLKVLEKFNGIDEMVVVSDGSDDETAWISERYGAKVIELPENRGKGAAIKAGLEACSGDVIILLDADLVGLNEAHVRNLLEPVVSGKCDMTIGIFHYGRLSTDLAQWITPHLSGQRALRRSILETIPSIESMGYGIEIALSKYCRKNGLRIKKIRLEELTHVTKEEKLGFLAGFIRRIKMYWQISRELILAKK